MTKDFTIYGGRSGNMELPQRPPMGRDEGALTRTTVDPVVEKAGPADEARDEHGKWTSGAASSAARQSSLARHNAQLHEQKAQQFRGSNKGGAHLDAASNFHEAADRFQQAAEHFQGGRDSHGIRARQSAEAMLVDARSSGARANRMKKSDDETDVEKYNPDQARDEKGQWASEGSGGHLEAKAREAHALGEHHFQARVQATTRAQGTARGSFARAQAMAPVEHHYAAAQHYFTAEQAYRKGNKVLGDRQKQMGDIAARRAGETIDRWSRLSPSV